MLRGEGASLMGADLPALSKSYGFDAMGNRTQTTDGVAKTQTNALYNRLNQVTGTSSYNTASGSAVLSSTATFGYDGDGNMTASVAKDASGTQVGQSIYSYDEASRLTGIETPGQSKWQFVYDGMSRLRISRFWTWQGGAWVAQQEIRRVYDGMDVVQERDSSNNVVASYTRTGNIGGILARTTASSSTFYAYDLGGNVTTLTDNAGAQVGSYTYDAWGNTIASSGAKAGENLYRFSTKENIAGFYSYGFRFYAPGLGRWINRDPIRERGGLNLYGFVKNDPVNLGDGYGCGVLSNIWSSISDTGRGIWIPVRDRWLGNPYDKPDPRMVDNNPDHMMGQDVTAAHKEFVSRGAGMVEDGVNLELSVCPVGEGAEVGAAAADGEEMLYRAGSREGANRLSLKAEQAEEQIGIHGVSAHTTDKGYDIVGVPRSEVEKHFTVHDTPNTPNGVDPTHRTIELPNPVTNRIADLFNRLFHR